MVFLFPRSWALGWSPALALAPTSDPSLQFVYTALACICTYRPWLPNLYLPVLAQICIYQPCLPKLHLLALGPKLHLPTLAPVMVPPVCFYQSRSRFYYYYHSHQYYHEPLPPPLLLQLLLLPLPPLLLIITRDTFTAAKSALNGPQNVFDENVMCCFGRFVDIMAKVFLIGEAAVIFKEIDGWLFLK